MTTTQDFAVRADSALSLSGVLASALPHDLGTAQGPTRYTVPAVFSRRPQPREIELLHGEATKQGLAHLVGVILRDISAQAAQERTHRSDELEALGLVEEERLESLRKAAADIH